MRKYHQPIEPYRIKSIEPIRLLSRHEREQRIRDAKYNLFRIAAEDVYLDFLTDSGTSAMSTAQWAAIMMGDESYAGARSFLRFERTIQEIFGKQHVIPCHQGRSAENLIFSTLLKPGDVVIANTHFDTTRANVMHKGGTAIDLPIDEAVDEVSRSFMGNMDVDLLEAKIREVGAERVKLVLLTVTNNSIGGQPVSMKNIREVSSICKQHGIRFFFDAARYAENAYFIKRDEPGYGDKSVKAIAQEMFQYCDGAMMSAKKDGLCNIGGFIALSDESLHGELTELLIIVEGFPTYGGLAGRDLEALAVGLEEALDFEYLHYRIGQVKYFGDRLKEAGMPIVEPTGGHAVFVDAGAFLPHIPAAHYPGQAVSAAFYVDGGIRTVEIGSIMFGGTDPDTGEFVPARNELVRIALPRRVYTNSQLDYVAEVAYGITAQKEHLRGFEITHEPKFLRHFTCELRPLESISHSVKV